MYVLCSSRFQQTYIYIYIHIYQIIEFIFNVIKLAIVHYVIVNFNAKYSNTIYAPLY